MECNKDDAVRAKDFAQTKMQAEDFEAAKKFALKAQNLYSGLENITQMITTCSVHCSAKNKIFGSEMDWYGVLQVERFSDEPTVKKQYRKLALVLHPDKNRFPGADGAFKLICEANAFLLDAKKKSDYDSKIRVMLQSTRFPPQQQQFNRKPSTNQTRAAAYSSTPVDLDAFWTSCPSCRMRYKYLRRYLNTYLRCQSCRITFLGCETGPRVDTGQASSKQNVPPKPEANQTGVDDSHGAGKSSGTDQNVGKGSCNGGAGAANPTKAPRGDPSEAKVDKGVRNADGKSKTRSKKVESGENSYTESDKETPDNQTSEESNARRSSRKRGNVSYDENKGDDFAGPPKRPRHTESVNGEAHDDDKAKSKHVEHGNKEQRGPASKTEDIAVDISSDFSLSSDEDAADEVSQCPDPEFSDFDQEREQSCFKVGQFWACYDTFDAMPRFYARVKNVKSSPFQLTFTWLEADPLHEPQMQWTEEFPAGCGRFKLGETEKTSSLPTFSHQMQCEKGSKRNNLVIYPREGEIWALFKDWDISWRLEPEKHRKFKYEIVEVLSNFSEQRGIEVIHMNKINGFVSLFQRAAARAGSFLVKHEELYRFSHRVLCKKMTGWEREGVPPGSYELDPASLPSNPEDLHFPHQTTDSAGLRSPTGSVKEGTCGKSTPKRGEGIGVEASFKPRRSPRGFNGVGEKGEMR